MLFRSFAYTCEAFVGVMPSVALFRHYFIPRTRRSRWIAGGVSFCLKKESAHQYLGAKIRANWGEWRHNWYFILANNPNPHLLVPTAPVEGLANSKDVSSQDEALLPAIRRLAELRDDNVTCAMITGDFIRRGIAPLQCMPQPLWEVKIGRAHV